MNSSLRNSEYWRYLRQIMISDEYQSFVRGTCI